MKPVDDEDLYTTSDFLTASYLLARGVQLFGKRPTGRRITFLFYDDDEMCSQYNRELMHGDDAVSASKLHTCMKRLKRYIYDS